MTSVWRPVNGNGKEDVSRDTGGVNLGPWYAQCDCSLDSKFTYHLQHTITWKLNLIIF
jgi:hypothetical protein